MRCWVRDTPQDAPLPILPGVGLGPADSAQGAPAPPSPRLNGPNGRALEARAKHLGGEGPSLRGGQKICCLTSYQRQPWGGTPAGSRPAPASPSPLHHALRASFAKSGSPESAAASGRPALPLRAGPGGPPAARPGSWGCGGSTSRSRPPPAPDPPARPTPRQCLRAAAPLQPGRAAAARTPRSFVARRAPSPGPLPQPAAPTCALGGGLHAGAWEPGLLRCRPGAAGARGCCGPSPRAAAPPPGRSPSRRPGSPLVLRAPASRPGGGGKAGGADRAAPAAACAPRGRAEPSRAERERSERPGSGREQKGPALGRAREGGAWRGGGQARAHVASRFSGRRAAPQVGGRAENAASPPPPPPLSVVGRWGYPHPRLAAGHLHALKEPPSASLCARGCPRALGEVEARDAGGGSWSFREGSTEEDQQDIGVVEYFIDSELLFTRNL
ncbi:translation initiation factor IF-2-like [Meles meles]|uniref:translation initiation factor IF-2-like n=1 Tax=Meles meles TaxID=9662 RepID=UPI001E6A0FBA|nr:translation initiation factor IF-2-like [Meles meles]